MKKISLLTVMLVILCVFLQSCTKNSDPLAYEKKSIRAEIIISMNGTKVGAELELSPLYDGTERDSRLVFLSPESMSGLTVTRKNGITETTLGDMTLAGLDGAALLKAAELFSTGGTVLSAEATELDGKKLTHLTVSSENEAYEIWLDSSGLPKRITSGELTVDVVWIECE